MSPEVLKFLFDIADSIKIIGQHLEDIPDHTSFENDLKTTDAVTRRLSIIGEALWKASKLCPGLNISDKDKIIGMRHILIHEYNNVDSLSIWAICKNNLTDLNNEVIAILEAN